MRTYEVFTQTTNDHGEATFRRVGWVDAPVYGCEKDGAERAGQEAIKVYADSIGEVFAVAAGLGFVILRRPNAPLPERVTI